MAAAVLLAGIATENSFAQTGGEHREYGRQRNVGSWRLNRNWRYLRVPHADVGPIKIESDFTDDQMLFLSDIFPTGWMAAENAEIEAGDTVADGGADLSLK